MAALTGAPRRQWLAPSPPSTCPAPLTVPPTVRPVPLTVLATSAPVRLTMPPTVGLADPTAPPTVPPAPETVPASPSPVLDTAPPRLPPVDPTTPRLKLLWDSDRAGVTFNYSKFCPPVVADGRLLVSTYDGRVDVYALPP